MSAELLSTLARETGQGRASSDTPRSRRSRADTPESLRVEAERRGNEAAYLADAVAARG